MRLLPTPCVYSDRTISTTDCGKASDNLKGLTHFAVGVAAASCFPAAVKAGLNGNPLYFILGGVAGLLPDTIDFKFRRFFSQHDVQVVPDPNRPDPQLIADAIGHAVNTAYARGKPLRIKLHTIELGADRWQRYTVWFDVTERRVVVRYGPIVSTGQTPEPESECLKPQEASSPLACPIVLDYEAQIDVDIFDGPLFRMTPMGNTSVRLEFIPWHRGWSHSLVTALLLALVGAAIGQLVARTTGGALWAGAVIFVAYAAHIIADQFGFLGSALLSPFNQRRIAGWNLMHATDALPNLATVWAACLVVFWNLYKCGPKSLPDLTMMQLLVFGAFVPLGLAVLARRLLRARQL